MQIVWQLLKCAASGGERRRDGGVKWLLQFSGYYTRRHDARRIARHVFSAQNDIFLKQNETAYHDLLAEDGAEDDGMDQKY